MKHIKPITVIAVAVLLISVSPGAVMGTHEADKPTKTQYSVRSDLGDEVYGSENVHYPGKKNGSIVLYITGEGHDLEEPFILDTLTIYSPLDTTGCEVTDITAGGIDRGNDDRYTKTDKSLVGAYKGQGNKTSDNSDLGPSDDPGPIAPDEHTYRQKSWIKFWQEGDFGGRPTTFYPDDEGLLALKDCIVGPTAPGWYRGWGKVNGTTTNSSERVSYTAFTNWNYVCKCDSYDEAVDTIGQPPNTGYTVERGQMSNQSGTTDTPTGSETGTVTTDSGTSTATNTDGSMSPSPTVVTGTDQNGAQQNPGQGSPSVTVTTSAADGSTSTSERGTAQGQQSTPTPTQGSGPGFGALSTVVALIALALLTRRQ